jgi:hypothetical protein
LATANTLVKDNLPNEKEARKFAAIDFEQGMKPAWQQPLKPSVPEPKPPGPEFVPPPLQTS